MPIPAMPRRPLSSVSAVRRSSLLAAVIALLLQSLAWGLLAPAAAAMPPPGAIAICTSDGIAYQATDGTLLTAGGDTTAAAKAGDHCPLCPLIGGLGLLPPAATAAPPTDGGSTAPVLPEERGMFGWLLCTLRARAPPVC